MTIIEDMKDKIIQAMEKGSVSFVELDREVPGFSGGDYSYGFPEKNIWLWFGMTRIASDAISELKSDGKIIMTPCDPLIYAVDGEIPHMERARQDRAYKSPRWLPVVMDEAR